MRLERIDRRDGVHKLSMELPIDLAKHLRDRAHHLEWTQAKVVAELLKIDKDMTGDSELGITLEGLCLVDPTDE